MMYRKIYRKFFFNLMFIGIIFSVISPAIPVYGETIDELKKKIDERNINIQQLEQEIGQYRSQVEAVGKEAKTLQNTVKTLDLTQKKLNTDISVTENKISATNYTIEKVNLEISDKETALEKSLASLADIMRGINENDQSTFLEVLLQHPQASEFWNDVEILDRLQHGIKSHLADLRGIKADLETKRTEHENAKKDLTTFKEDLVDKKKVVEVSKQEKNNLLLSTKSKESNYKQILADKMALRDAFQKELINFESQLKIAIDPASYAKAEKGILAWPLDIIKITQYFGNTAFAQSGAYNGQGHNGIDLGTPVGTPVKSAGDGIIVGTGNTDLVCPNASYGQWILVEHKNGLSTLYGHLSLIKVNQGQEVTVGQVIGYSGTTGYSTGPHLHFTVYATQGVKILAKKSAVCGGTYVMPIADLKAYLNPLSYL